MLFTLLFFLCLMADVFTLRLEMYLVLPLTSNAAQCLLVLFLLCLTTRYFAVSKTGYFVRNTAKRFYSSWG
jgi:hypothetical protein